MRATKVMKASTAYREAAKRESVRWWAGFDFLLDQNPGPGANSLISKFSKVMCFWSEFQPAKSGPARPEGVLALLLMAEIAEDDESAE